MDGKYKLKIIKIFKHKLNIDLNRIKLYIGT